ncbi:hypothetical protein AB3Z07_27275 (plasmid) [Metabacillus halosaccharovorans]|uniref:hypothetical protein n=1 Tax=Metabacillus halosaccharovorans TaxID=930124 RepID=UPI0034CD0F77
MNNLRWLTSLFNGRNNRWMFRNRRNNIGMMLSLLSLGVGAATTYGMTRGRANRMTQITEQPILIRV